MKLKILLLIFVFYFSKFYSFSSEIDERVLNKIVNSIFVIEGGEKTKYFYGIKSILIKGNSKQEKLKYARRICENTVRNNFQRWQAGGRKGKFLDFLGDKYCPKISDEKGNIHWKKNIRLVSGFDF